MNFEAPWGNFEGLWRDFEGTPRAIKMKLTLRDDLIKSTSMRL
jgi:hypothetical protein